MKKRRGEDVEVSAAAFSRSFDFKKMEKKGQKGVSVCFAIFFVF